MNCEKCGAENAHFMGSSQSWGPAPSDAENTPDNLPGGYAWLCEDCAIEISFAEMVKSSEEMDREMAEQDRADWLKKWPGHCPTCNGLGLIVYQDDPSPSGVSLSPGTMEFSDPCDCLEDGNCPRCGKKGWADCPTETTDWENEPCLYCGWSSSAAERGEEGMVCPPAPPPPDIPHPDSPELDSYLEMMYEDRTYYEE